MVDLNGCNGLNGRECLCLCFRLSKYKVASCIFTFLYFRCHKMQAFVSWQIEWGCQHLFVGLNAVVDNCWDWTIQCSTTRFPVETCKNRIHRQVHKNHLQTFPIFYPFQFGLAEVKPSKDLCRGLRLNEESVKKLSTLQKTRFSFSRNI